MRHSLTIVLLSLAAGVGLLAPPPAADCVTKDSHSSEPQNPPITKLLYILKPEGFPAESNEAMKLLLELRRQIGQKLTDEARVKSRVYGGGDVCAPTERCEDVIINREEASTYVIYIFCSDHHSSNVRVPSVDSETLPLKIARMIAKHDIYHKQ